MPVISPAPAMPAKAPDSTITMMIVRPTPIPAYLAAFGLAPTVRTSKPKLVRLRTNHTSTHRLTASEEPEVHGRGRCG